MPRLLSFQETANQLKATRVTLYAIIERGELTPHTIYKIGKRTKRYFDADQVTQLAKYRNEAYKQQQLTPIASS